MPAATAGLAPAVVFVSASAHVRRARCRQPGAPVEHGVVRLQSWRIFPAHGNYLNIELRTLVACALTLQ
ncbi:hypothetical protein AB0I02_28280 [Streptomyces phaeochromogenes]